MRCSAQGTRKAGLRHLRGILAFEPRDYLANYGLVSLCANSSRCDEARNAAARAHEVSGSPQALAGLLDSWKHVLDTEKRPSRFCKPFLPKPLARSMSRIQGSARFMSRLAVSTSPHRKLLLAQAEGDWDWLGGTGPALGTA